MYVTGMNRIRAFLQEAAPASRPYYVLPPYDDAAGLYRSVGTGMNRTPPRIPLLYLVAQTQGIVGVVTAVVAAACAALAAAPRGAVVAGVAAALAFVVALVSLVVYWQRSLAELHAGLRPVNPTPPQERGAPF